MFHCVMQTNHVMIGADVHQPFPSPPLPPLGVYLTISTLEGVWASVSNKGPKHEAHSGRVMCRGTDIGTTIHIPVVLGGVPYPLLAVEILLAGSKSFFGPQSFKQADASGAPKPVCAAALGPVNINVNCCMPAPLPVGLVVAPTTYVTGMTAADVVSGIVQGVVDTAMQYAISRAATRLARPGGVITRAGSWVAGKLGPVAMRSVINPLSRQLGRLTAPLAGRMGALTEAAGRLREPAARLFAGHATQLRETAAAFLFGDPYGASIDNVNPWGWSPYGALANAGGGVVGMQENENTGDFVARKIFGKPVPVHAGQ